MQQELTDVSGVRAVDSVDTSGAFATAWEHLECELQCLDLRLQREHLKQRPRRAGNELSAFAGLVIGDGEAARLLSYEEQETDATAADRLRLDKSIIDMQSMIRRRVVAAHDEGLFLPLARLSELFSLTRFDEDCLLVSLAPDIDRRYTKLYAYLQDDATRKRPSVDFVLDLLLGTTPQKLTARDCFLPGEPLMSFRLLEWAESEPHGEPLPLRALKVDERIANYLLGSMAVDGRLQRFAKLISPVDRPKAALGPRTFYESAHSFIEAYLGQPPAEGRNLILSFHGEANSDRQLIVQELCRSFGLPMLVADIEAMRASPLPFEKAVWLLAREAALQSAVLVLENMDALTEEPEKLALEQRALLDAARLFSRITFVCGTRAWQPKLPMPACLFLSQAVAGPDLETSKRVWQEGIERRVDWSFDANPAELAGKFRFGAGQIEHVLSAAENLAHWRSPQGRRVTASDLYAACRTHSSPRLGTLARKIEARYKWHDMVLPEDSLAQLQALCEQARHRQLVYGEWGFDRKLSLGKGLNALFIGPPGTGKTMAAEVIARELQLDLYRIDLSQIVSKYIGDTEKNLHHIFAEAQAGNAILFFDEADSLFGKRSEVKDAHDRFANIEVGYLLQKMEEYEGVAILATNLGRNMDEAFSRRMHFIVEFPFPDEPYRKRIWQVAFPKEAPLADDVDFGVLAHEIRLSGGNIKNIALAAAFYAAGGERVIRMPHLWQAARREHQKLGRTWEFDPAVASQAGRIA